MKRHHPMPALRNALLSAAMALLAGVSAVPSFAQTQLPETTAPTPTPTAPHVTQAGPASVADLAEGLLEAVVNISTSQNVKGTEGQGTVPLPQAPEGSPFQDFFDEFFKDREGGGGGQQKVQSLGSASSSMPRKASSSPTTTSSPTPTRSRSISPTAPS